MSKTNYSKKFIYTGLSFNKTSLSQEENDKSDFRISRKTKDSWKFFSNLKALNGLKRTNSLQSIHNYFSQNKNNPNYVPISNKYSIIKANKAPSLRENIKEINKIIKKKKLEKKENFSNIYNTILINESKLFRSNIYITGGGINSLRTNSKTIGLEKNLSNEQNRIYKSIGENNSSSLDNVYLNYDSGLNNNSLNNESNILNDTKKMKSKSKTQYPLVYNTNSIPRLTIKKYEGENLSSIRNKNNDNKMQNITRMRMEINDLIFNNYKLRGEFANLEKKMIKFKIIQKAQNSKLKNSLYKDLNSINQQCNKLIKLKKEFENKFILYLEKMKLYLKFLVIKSKEMTAELFLIIKQKEEKYIEIEKITLDIIKKQNELESLIDKRNFLLQIKQKYRNPPTYYEELLIKDSKKLLIGNALSDLDILKHTQNKNVIDFLSSVSEIKRKCNENILNINNLKADLYISHHFVKFDPIFDSVDDFIHLYNYLKDKSLDYLKRSDIEKKYINKMKKEYEDYVLNNNNYLEDEINEKEIERKKIMHKYSILRNTYNYYKDNILKKINDVNVKAYSFKNKINQKRFISVENDLSEKYNVELKKYKYGGILLFKKLIKLINYYSENNYDKSDYYSNLFDDKKLELTLKIDINEFNDDNITLINRYILLLVSKYEKICKYVLNKHQIYLLNDKNRRIIKVKKDEITKIRKHQVAKEIRNLIKKKKIGEINKIIEKSNKSIDYIPNRFNYDIQIKRNKEQKNTKVKIISYYNNNNKSNLEKEFNDLTKYNDNNI